jgi:hypothetical protein
MPGVVRPPIPVHLHMVASRTAEQVMGTSTRTQVTQVKEESRSESSRSAGNRDGCMATSCRKWRRSHLSAQTGWGRGRAFCFGAMVSRKSDDPAATGPTSACAAYADAGNSTVSQTTLPVRASWTAQLKRIEPRLCTDKDAALSGFVDRSPWR